MALLLILSYAAVSHTILEVSTTGESDDDSVFVAVLGVPLIVLGVCIILKCFIVLVGFKRTTILTWSPSPLSNTFAAITAGQVARREGLCMYNILDVIRVENSPGTSFPPKKPSAVQPSAWRTRRGIRRTVIALWVLVVACGVWGGIIVAVWGNTSLKEVTPGLESWSIVPNSRSNAVKIPLVFNSALNWFTCFCVLVVVQGSLTLALHCCELIVNVLRDEAIWRKATTKGGTKSSDVLRSFGSFWPSIALLMGKAVLQWLFGFCLSLEGSLILGAGCELASNDATNPCGNIVALPIVMRSIQIWYLTIALGLFSTVMTFLATYQPRGPQPAAYGHTQTLANLIDDWSPSMTMWWGHKDGGGYEKDGEYIFHAGTNSSPLPGVKLDGLYA
ncbi:hypothetical protein BDY19DRAFT_992829 [Irpex rosettiformis]|uniref:Uncharacterized protein n=1 Tax=Irpex rosettiformis TaxID=378272 RepID=A0ACB8U6A9_9APHY|nr:hypothetical protein BDY19DRAFT_992829 [Irpex rosettiformis]